MNPPFERGPGFFHLGVLLGASLLVPSGVRAEWWREWHAELWHVRQACAQNGGAPWQVEWDVTAFCLGAFQDALCVRRQRPQRHTSLAASQGSASHCMLVLAGILAASYMIAQVLPGVRAERRQARYPVNPGLLLIRDASYKDDATPTITGEQFLAWKGRTQRYFNGLAYYRIGRETVSDAPAKGRSHGRVGWEVARSSLNLFALLGVPLRLAAQNGEEDDKMPRVILSEGIWRREFDGNPLIAGSVVHLGSGDVRIAGVVPDGAWKLPGRADAWVLESDAEIRANGVGGVGHVVAHLTDLGQAAMGGVHIHITELSGDESEDLVGVSLNQLTPSPRMIFLFAAVMALLALPAITSVSLGEYSLSPQRTSWPRRVYRWGFLSAKIGLFLPIVYFVSLDLAFARAAFAITTSVYIQLASTFLMCLFGLSWMLKDQRQRCPVCLRRVEHPAQVGQASRTFLAWNGTEMMCMGGHTLLHVPALPTSWFSTQRWLYLDTSWGFLFAGPGAGINNEGV